MPAATETRKECLSSMKEAFMKRLMALTLGIVATSALAQAAPSTANPDAGFFRPDDLAVPKAAAQPRPGAGNSIAEMRKAEVALRIEEETLRIEEEALRIENGSEDRIERQMDRVERENERARE
jgi:hypothetical protein